MRRRSFLLSVVLFVLTALSAVFAGGYSEYQGHGLWGLLREGVPYSAALLCILLTHELAHYFAARLHGVDTSPPYFIPLPVGFGTLGAVIRIRSVIPSRIAVLDIGASGPIAGFLVALPLLFMGVASSQVLPAPSFPVANQDYQSLLSILTALRDGRLTWPPAESKAMLLNDSLITWLATVLTHGPLPENAELRLNSIALAAWVGMFVTTLNLTPLGQLDGGHVIYALFGRWAELISRMVSWALLGLGIFASTNWLFWWLLTRLLVGVQHPPSPDLTPLTPRRRAVAIFSLVILALTFIPAPITY